MKILRTVKTMKLLLCTLLVILHSAFVESQCTLTQEESCILDAECYGAIYINGIWNYHCELSQWKIHVELKRPKDSTISIINGEYSGYIIELKLNDNEFFEMPIIMNFFNLEVLNVANNLLSEAKLYNENDLGALKEINFSFNSINILSIDIHQHVYRELIFLNISHNYLATLPDAIFDLFPKLETLDLSHNLIDTLTFMSFEGLKKLRYLNLDNNKLSEINLSLLRFNMLEELHLANNLIKVLDSRDFENFTKLKTFDVKNNLVEHINGNIIHNMLSLNEFDISNNILESIDTTVFAQSIYLLRINLSYNRLNTLPNFIFNNNSNVLSLSVQGNKLEGAIKRGVFNGLKLVPELDLSFQKLTTLDNYAFLGLNTLTSLLLNNNKLESLAKNCFKSLQHLNILDLSNNRITTIAFDMSDLVTLETLSLNNNFISQIQIQDFRELFNLNYIELSNNTVTHIESNSFQSLNNLVDLGISKNPLSNILEENTFRGLSSLPNLDISQTSITVIKNGSFSEMVELTFLNMSHSKIREIEYNAFVGTSSIKVIHLSHNELRSVNIDTSYLSNLEVLSLNNNLLKQISSTTLKGLFSLNIIDIACNVINNIADSAFEDQTNCEYLDVSYNIKLKLNTVVVQKMQSLHTLIMSGTAMDSSIYHVNSSKLVTLEFSHSVLNNITKLEINSLNMLIFLKLSNNNLTKIEVGNFNGLKELRNVDLSFNKISFIQPGSFKENTLLNSLNISHNNLTSISYGVFSGLIFLNTVNLSYNEITSLKAERFYEVRSLTHLIVDHNKITYIGTEEFPRTTLSIGENPLPCEILVKLKNNNNPDSVSVTALRLDHESENVDGVTCNKNVQSINVLEKSTYFNASDKLLVDIKNMFRNTSYPYGDRSEKLLEGIKDILQNMTLENTDNKSEVRDDQTVKIIADKVNKTNCLLEKILLKLQSPNKITVSQVPTSDQEFYTPSSLYMNKVKQNSDDTLSFVNNKMIDLDNKIRALSSRLDNGDETTTANKVLPAASLTNDNFQKQYDSDIKPKSFLFTEICVALILIILISLVFYKFYKSNMLLKTHRSLSTREIIDSVESSNL